ncbi:MAG: hypothetical protein IJP28_01215 [Erysipelotrichales bacterium]|nr:hypothetical protein [Erysipelotrichales bacterium]
MKRWYNTWEGDFMKGMLVESVNDILSLFTLGCIVGIPVFYFFRSIYSAYVSYSEKRFQRLMKEEDWHM